MNVLIPGRNIVLVGLMGSGKTAVGRLVAERLGRPFVDTDDVVAEEAGKPIRAIFEEDGERAFRALESEIVRGASTLRGRVVAVGGGAVLDPSNVTHLRSTGDLVLLDADPEILARRLEEARSHDRPMLDGVEDVAARLAELRAQRERAYRRATPHRLDTNGRTPEEVAEAVLAWARRRPGLLTREELL